MKELSWDSSFFDAGDTSLWTTDDKFFHYYFTIPPG